MYLKKDSDALGELLIDNGGNQSSGWSTPLPDFDIFRLGSWIISGNARVSTTNGVRVANGNPAQFVGLINSNYLQVGWLIVSNTWVYGDVADLSLTLSNSLPTATLICQPLKTYILFSSTNLVNWTPIFTNTPTSSRFDYLDSNAPSYRQRFYRAEMVSP